MGSRANLIIVQQQKYYLYYCHWCANTIIRDLFWGPEPAMQFISAQQRVDHWLDDIWSEGGALLDMDRKALLLFGGDDMRYDIQLRRVYMRLIQEVWNGWFVKWANEGIAELADYVGYPRGSVIDTNSYGMDAVVSKPDNERWVSTVVSVLSNDGHVSVFPLLSFVENYLSLGPNILNVLPSLLCQETLDMRDWDDGSVCGGCHIDLASKSINYWHADSISGIEQTVREKWLGWSVNSLWDHYEEHERATQGKLLFPIVDKTSHITKLKRLLLGEWDNPADIVLDIVDKRSSEGHRVEVNPQALQVGKFEVPLSERQRIFHKALNALNL